MPPELARIVRTCVQKDPDQRFFNADELADELETFLSPPGVTAAIPLAAGVTVLAVEGRYRTYETLHRRHEKIFGRTWAVDRITQLAADRARHGGVVVIVGQPGKGKSALMAHLVRDVFIACEPPPVVYAYQSACGMTSPDDFVRTVYGRLLQIHHVADESDRGSWHNPDAMLTKLSNFVHHELASRVTPANPQLMMVDALDEARESHTGRMPWQMIPESLPPGVVFIVSSRPDTAEPLLRRPDAARFDLDDPDDRAFHDQDLRAYIGGQFHTRRLASATANEIVRASRGNFLVLKHLCIESHLATDETRVADLLQRLLRFENGLLTVYKDFWERLSRGSREDGPGLSQSVCDVAAVLALAGDRMSADMVCSILAGMKSGTWLSVRRRLGEYIEPWMPEGGAVAYYRIYHETFAEFIRTKVLTEGERKRLHGLIADFCLGTPTDHYARIYALRFAPWHLQQAERWEELQALLTDLRFLEAKTQAGLVFELARDYTEAAEGLPQRWILRFLGEALRRDIHFIHRHASDYPQSLFQCLWNTCWWYDCEDAAAHYVEPYVGWSPKNAPWMQPADQKLCRLLERWRDQKLQTSPGLVWLRTHGPPSVRLGTAQQAVLRGHDNGVNSVTYSPDGLRIASGSTDGTIRVWDAKSGAQLAILCEHEDGVNSVTYSPDGHYIASGSADGTIRVWDAKGGISWPSCANMKTASTVSRTALTAAASPADLRME